MRTEKQNQMMQLSHMTDYFIPIFELEEIPYEGTYFLKNDEKENHWLYTKLRIIAARPSEGKIYWKFPDGTMRTLSYEELENTFYYDRQEHGFYQQNKVNKD